MAHSLSRATGSARNECVEFRGSYVIHCYSFPDSDRCDLHARGPSFRHAIYDIAPEDAATALKQMQALIDVHALSHN